MLPAAVEAWHDAVNRRDLPAAVRSVTDPVEVSGPRGSQAISAAAFADWIVHSGIHLEPLSVHRSGADAVIVEQDATWPDHPDPEAASTAPTRVATVFEMRDGVVSLVHRFDSLSEALRSRGGETR